MIGIRVEGVWTGGDKRDLGKVIVQEGGIRSLE